MLTRFYNAEIEHKEYFDLNTNQPYCAAVISPKIRKLMQQNKEILKKHILQVVVFGVQKQFFLD
jgi:hypothetical protein